VVEKVGTHQLNSSVNISSITYWV